MRRGLLLAVLLLLSAPASALAQVSLSLGPRVGVGLNSGDDSAGTDNLYAGADARLSVIALPVDLNAAFDYYFTDIDDYTLWQLTINGLYTIGIPNPVFQPYFGAGLSIINASYGVDLPGGEIGFDGSDQALNLLFGARFSLTNINPFVQANFLVGGDVDAYGLTAGLLFRFGP